MISETHTDKFFNCGFIDIIENLFGQQMGPRSGMNTNTTLAHFGPANAAIILGNIPFLKMQLFKQSKFFHGNMTTQHHQTQVTKSNKLRKIRT